MKEENKKRRNIILSLLLLLLIAGGITGYFLSRKEPQAVSIVSGEFLPESKDASKISEKELKKTAQEAVDKSKFNLMIAPEATFDKQSRIGNLTIKNPPENAYPVNVEVREKATNQLVYTSGAIQPGYEIKEAVLEKELKEGEHQAVAMFSIYDPETKEKRGQVAAGMTLIVQ